MVDCWDFEEALTDCERDGGGGLEADLAFCLAFEGPGVTAAEGCGLVDRFRDLISFGSGPVSCISTPSSVGGILLDSSCTQLNLLI